MKQAEAWYKLTIKRRADTHKALTTGINATTVKFDCEGVRKAVRDAPIVGSIDPALPTEAGAKLEEVQKLRNAAEAQLVEAFEKARAEDERRRGIVAVTPEEREPVRAALGLAKDAGLNFKTHLMVKDGSSARKYYNNARKWLRQMDKKRIPTPEEEELLEFTLSGPRDFMAGEKPDKFGVQPVPVVPKFGGARNHALPRDIMPYMDIDMDMDMDMDMDIDIDIDMDMDIDIDIDMDVHMHI